MTINNKGFTLIEIAMILLIGGVLIASLSSGLVVYMRTAKMSETRNKMEQIDEAISLFISINGRLPCPASPQVAPDTVGFGREVGAAGSDPIDCTGNGAMVAPTTGGAAAPGTVRVAGGGGRNVRIGALPVRALNLPDSYIMDGYGNRFTYAVTVEQTLSATYVPGQGAIRVIDSLGNDVFLPASTADRVVISHGQNGLGAYTLQGGATIPKPCPAAATVLERQNCDFADATFRQTLLTATAANTEGYDDMISSGRREDPGLPTGAVVAFNLAACPQGWTPYLDGVGRFVVGATTLNAAPTESYPTPAVNPDFTPTYALGATGGAARVEMQVAEMPSHTHQVGYKQGPTTGGPPLQIASVTDISGDILNASYATGGAGSGLVHENRPPYVALLYCQKQ